MFKAIKPLLLDVIFSFKYIKNLFSNQNSRKRSEELRNRVKQMALSKESTDEWIRNQAQLKELILAKNPFNFLRWKVIKDTMFYGGDRNELADLRASSKSQLYDIVMREEPCGNPRPFFSEPSSSGNRIHHLYNIEQLLKFDEFSLDESKSIIEFGGGYGSMANLFYKLGFGGSYNIFDFELFNALQEYYISSTLGNAITTNFNTSGEGSLQVNLLSDLDQIDAEQNSYDTFIAMWSLSESPLELREEIWDRIGSPNSILIGYQQKFSNIDNQKYFTNLTLEKKEYEWSNWEIPHLPGHYYLVGLKK